MIKFIAIICRAITDIFHTLYQSSVIIACGGITFLAVSAAMTVLTYSYEPHPLGHRAGDVTVVYMPRVVTEVSMRELYTAFIYAKEGDKIEIVADTNGGSVFAAKLLVKLIKHSKAKASIRIIDYTASAGAYISCSVGNVTSQFEDSKVMVHRARADFGYSNANELVRNAFLMVMLDIDLWNVCKPFMTVDQWDLFLAGEDVWFPASQLNDPLTYLKSEAERAKNVQNSEPKGRISLIPEEEVDKHTRPERKDRLPRR